LWKETRIKKEYQILIEALGYCGLVCNVCKNTVKSPNPCRGCRNEGGDPDCFQRACCVGKEFEGCWQCDKAPCEHGYFDLSNEAWAGFSRGFVQCIKKVGSKEFLRFVESKMGRTVEYGDFRFKKEREIIELLLDDEEKTHC
jgi:hypothetical protein